MTSVLEPQPTLDASRPDPPAGARRPLASVSLDLDNLWSYLKTHGDAGWESRPTYLPRLVPRVLEFLAARGLSITFFVVGQDAARSENQPALAEVAAAGHEIGNHSFEHEPWLHLYSDDQLRDDFDRAEAAIQQATGRRPRGFRGPGFSWSPRVLDQLAERGYVYDGSTFPTFLGPLARAYYFLTARLSAEERQRRRKLFGGWAEGLRPNRPYRWQTACGSLIEIPVTTLPVVRTPIHASYLIYLSSFSEWAARAYFRAALAACRATGTPPSLLLHPLDFLGAEDCPALTFFPGMRLSAAHKLRVLDRTLDRLARRYEIVPMLDQARELSAASRLRTRAAGPTP